MPSKRIKVRYALLDPFNAAFSLVKEREIYIDRVFKNTDAEKHLLRHEKKHFEKTRIEPVSVSDLHVLPELLKKKPLMSLQIFFPFAMAKYKDRTMFKIDPLGMFVFLFITIGLVLLFTLSVVSCTTYMAPNMELYDVCTRCSFWGCEPFLP